jgi:FkbM family methyltransferase
MLKKLHQKLILNKGSWLKELPEQKMILKFLPKNSKILEFGGNIGRASLISNSIINDKTQHLVLESNKTIVRSLRKNKQLNNSQFQILNAALSNKPMIYKHWNTQQSDVILKDWKKVNIVNLDYIKNSYNIPFNTIIADCEGAFVNILKDFPEILNGIKMIFIEHDFNTNEDFYYFISIMNQNNYKMIHYIEKIDVKLPKFWGVTEDKFFHSIWLKL